MTLEHYDKSVELCHLYGFEQTLFLGAVLTEQAVELACMWRKHRTAWYALEQNRALGYAVERIGIYHHRLSCFLQERIYGCYGVVVGA